MLGYLQKFNSLPIGLRSQISSPYVMEKISELEKKYNVKLATVVMRVMIKDIEIADLAKFFEFEDSLDDSVAVRLAKELTENIFLEFKEYLGIKPEEKKDKNIFADQTSKRSSSFYFSPEDEEEVNEINKNLISKPTINQTEPIDKKIESILEDIKISFSSDELGKRLRQTIKTYVKGIRKKIDTRQILSKSVSEGGLEMDNNLIDQILIKADIVRDELHTDLNRPTAAPFKKLPGIVIEEKELKENNRDKITEKKESLSWNDINKLNAKNLRPLSSAGDDLSKKIGLVSRDVEYDYSKLKEIKKSENSDVNVNKTSETKTEQTIKKQLNVVENKNDIIDLSGGVEKDALVNQNNIIKSEKNKNLEINNVSEQSTIKNQSPIINRKINNEGKRRMDDVKYVPKLTGPLDELREMTLLDFRRLSRNPQEAAGKIRNKIDQLEEESYGQRLEGINAWRQSPINSVYLKTGNKAINNKLSIENIINNSVFGENNSLTEEEFVAIMDLNKSLRF